MSPLVCTECSVHGDYCGKRLTNSLSFSISSHFFFFCLVALLDEIAKKLLVALVTLSCNFAWIHKVYVWYGMYVI